MHTQPQLQLQPQPQPQTHPSRPVSPVTRSQTPSASQNRTTPSRSQTPPIHNPNWHPPPDTSTYRDLLLFEERLKSNAEMLRRRRTRYSAFLWSFVAGLGGLGYRVVFLPPETLFPTRLLQASLAVVLITLVLFFASGMYEEKIRYAHSYITHSNKALRPINMHLNMRRPFPILFRLPFSHSSSTSSTTSCPSPTPTSTATSKRTPSVMSQIPPSTNPRGELIFSSRVDRAFREGYERYRAAFERRREEKARAEIKGGLFSSSGGGQKREMIGAGSGGVRGRTPSPGETVRRGERGEREARGEKDKGDSYSFAWTGRAGPLRRAP